MYKPAEASRLRHEFWTTFGKYMSPVPAAGEEKVNWINYRTGIKDLYFRMDASRHGASICISIEQESEAIRRMYFERFVAHRSMLETALGEVWNWQPDGFAGESKPVARICREIGNVSVFRKDDWPELISFFKPRLIGLDEFWSNARYGFDDLAF